MRRSRIAAALLALAAGVPACASLNPSGAGEFLGEVAEFLGSSNPVRHASLLEALHDTDGTHHVPDEPGTVDHCLKEVRVLASSDYGSWREVAVAAFFLTRVATGDPAAMSRGEAVRGLARFGTMLGEAEEATSDPAPEDEITRALPRLRALHDRETGDHVGEGAEAGCMALVRRFGDFRLPLATEPHAPEIRYQVKVLRGTLMALLIDTRSEGAHADAGIAAGIDRAAVNLAGQAVRAAVLAALDFDPDERVREAAAGVLGEIRPAGSVSMLRHAREREKSPTVRRRIVQALGGLALRATGPEKEIAVLSLILALEDDDRSVGWNAREALRTLAGEDLGDRSDPWVRWWNRAKTGP